MFCPMWGLRSVASECNRPEQRGLAVKIPLQVGRLDAVVVRILDAASAKGAAFYPSSHGANRHAANLRHVLTSEQAFPKGQSSVPRGLGLNQRPRPLSRAFLQCIGHRRFLP